MSAWLRRAGLTALVLALSWWAHARVLGAGPTGRELRLLATLVPEGLPPEVAANLPPPPAPLARGLITLCGGPERLLEPRASWWRVRVLALASLLVTALAAGALVRAALSPWLGGDSAAWAGRAAILLTPLHPLAGASLGSVEALGLLVAAALGVSACAVFLRGRQERRSSWILASFALLALAAVAARAALVFALWMALVEFTSARRHRPLALRLRTSATTLVVGVAASVALGWSFGGLGARAEGFASTGALDGLDELAFAACEKLGVLLLPGGAEAGSAMRLIALGALVLVVSHPGFVAARSAPRLWGWIAGVTSVALFAALLLHPRVRVPPGELAASYVLLPAQLVLGCVLAAASTALAGARRWMLPVVLAVAWAGAARTIASAWPRSAALVSGARADAREALERHTERDTPPARLWWVESNSALRNVDRLAALDLLVPLALLGGEAAPLRATRVSALDAPTLLALAREPQFDEWRAAGLIVLVPAASIQRAAPRSGSAPARGGRSAFVLAPRGAAPTKRSWRGDSSSPLLDFDPARVPFVRVIARPDASTSEPPTLSWRALEPECETGTLTGTWIRTESGAQAIFETGASLSWLLGRRIVRVLVEGGLVHEFASAELLDDLPESRFASVPTREGADWVFPRPAATPPVVLQESVHWSLCLLDLQAQRSERFECSVREDGALVASRAAFFAERAEGPLAWSLESRAGSVTLLRASGQGKP